ncbi:hypothetical protein [Bradyrhizobium sp. SZCCHNRI2049]|uniref:hypothetical protein n=1 Tax=Bradyrhizobium sp. SZCCHNRI2049 TaxID=3057287 RepID=UPI0029162494|nr:hypothetical protein [Bradyrhizobium sp. SZCCHNRI2049]
MTKKTRADEALLGQLHLAVAKELLAKVQSGEATPAEINAAIKFLQNNNIEVDTVPEGTELDKLAKSLPTFDDEDSEGQSLN